MRQPLALDRPARASYHAIVVLGLAVAAAACVPGLKSIAPVDLTPTPLDSVVAWTREFQPGSALKYDLRWRFENSQGVSSGRAAVRFAPPDTLRFDFRGPFGKSGSAVVVGDSAVWAEPEGDFRSLVPVAPILWAALGITIPAWDGATLYGRDAPERRAWRYVEGDEAIDFIFERTAKPRLLAELRRADRIVGVARVQLAAASQRPTTSVMLFPRDRSKFTLTVKGIDSVAAFPPDTWQRQ